MKILVTGGAGFLGRALVARLTARGDEVVVLDPAADPSSPWALAVRSTIAADLAGTLEHYRPEVVVHLAAQFDVARSFEQPATDAERNCLDTAIVVQESTAANVRKIVFPSTSLVYGPGAMTHFETDPHDPASPYAAAKSYCQSLLRVVTAHGGPDHGIAVLGNVYGPGGDNVVSWFARRLASGEPVERIDPVTRDFVHVEDVVSALVALADAPGSQECNIAGGVERSLRQVHDHLAELLDLPRWQHGMAPTYDRVCLSRVRAQQLLGWEPVVDFADGLAGVAVHEQSLPLPRVR